MSLLPISKKHKSQLNKNIKHENNEINCKTLIISKNKKEFQKKKK